MPNCLIVLLEDKRTNQFMKRSILLIESNRAMQYLLSTILNSKYHIRCTENSRQAMQLFANGYEADLVVLDIADLKTENFELMEHISTSSIFKNVQVIVLSENRNEEFKNVCLEIGASVFLTKPFDPVYLFERTNQLLSENMPDVIPKRRRIFNNMNIF
jgi:CheY-like chemotaxis protein